MSYGYRRFVYYGKGRNPHVGEILMAPQPGGLAAKVISDPYIPPEILEEKLAFWFGEFDLKVYDTGTFTLFIPKGEKWGRVLNNLAKALYQIQQGYKTPDPTQTQLTKEARK